MKAMSRDRLGDHRCDQAAFAVADQADASRVDFFAALEKCDSREHILGKVGRSGIRDAAGRAADAAVVDAQHRDAAAREKVGQHEERLVFEDRFVTILRLPSR